VELGSLLLRNNSSRWSFPSEIPSQNIARAAAAIQYISSEVEKFYFSKAREYQAQGILKTNIKQFHAQFESPARIEVIDLPSFRDERTRFLALNSVLATEWYYARRAWAEALEKPADQDNRVPTFIVLDEAHNLIPRETRGLASIALREQFRTIAAEGRKYGLFLILCTQRPDKIDPLVLSECENRAIMKLGSRAVLNITQELLGLDDIPMVLLAKCLEFETGRALLVGSWASAGPELLYCAMRRTVEGGRSLRSSHWAVAPDRGITTGRKKIPTSSAKKDTRLARQRKRAGKRVT
jgi:hypothetical protein